MTYDIHDARYLQQAEWDREIRRIFDMCHGCRLCYPDLIASDCSFAGLQIGQGIRGKTPPSY